MRRFVATCLPACAGLLLGACGGGGAAAPSSCGNLDLRADVCDTARSIALTESLPEARGDAKGDDYDAAMLGFKLFFDPDIGNGIGCVQCHAPEDAFTDRKSVSTGLGVGTRNAPSVFNAARLTVFFWDGRADSLWSQPLFAIENPLEMGSSSSRTSSRTIRSSAPRTPACSARCPT